MSSIIIGTAGHIDHGKTALIKALNGVDGDRMQSEKERGITIDLSFSNLTNGRDNIAFIDVPGHENLVKTMISGAHSFDACMLVVSSDDSLMPQSIEHIRVLSLLNIKSIILCITKCDLSSKERVEIVEKECLDYIAKFSNLEVLATFYLSIKDNESIDELKNYLFNIKPKKRDENGLFHYYIDRVFSLKGLGTIVTGSLTSGSVQVDEKIYHADLGKILSVKSVQIHDKSVDIAHSPNRVALNLSGIETSNLKKGQILTKKGYFRGFDECDCTFVGEISHNENITFCVGSKSVNARCVMIDENLKLATFKFSETMFLKFSEPFVAISNSRVIGGGVVLNPIKEPLKKQNKTKLLSALLKANFKEAFKILSTFHRHGFGIISSYQRFNLSREEALKIAREVEDVFLDEEALCIYDKSSISDIKNIVCFIISKNPHAIFSPYSVVLKLSWASENLAKFALDELVLSGEIVKNGGVYIKNGVNFDEIQTSIESKIYEILKNGGISPNAPYNIYEELNIDRTSGDNALKSLTKAKKVIRLEHNLFISAENLSEVTMTLREIIKKEGFVNIKNAKDRLNLSRKFLIAYLDYMDNFEDIIKVDNNRVFKK